MFWINAFLGLKILNSVSSLFYVSRGLGVDEIVYLSLFWAIATLLFEVPSSYLADRWGRKRTLLLGIFFGLVEWTIFFFAHGFWQMAIGFVFFGLLSACISGTDIAFIYDSKLELGEKDTSLRELGMYNSGLSAFKIFSIILGGVIAKDLLPWQFHILLGIDFVSTLVALGIATTLAEPNHYMDIEAQEAGTFFDAMTIVRKYPALLTGVLNKTLVFVSAYAVWSYYQVFFHSLGLSIAVITLVWAIRHFVGFVLKRSIHLFLPHESHERRIRFMNIWYVWANVFVMFGYAVHLSPLLCLVVWCTGHALNDVRDPLFDDYFNHFSFSFNRATTLSLVNLVYNLLEIPIILAAGFLVGLHPLYPYLFTIGLAIGVLIFFRLPDIRSPREL